MKKITLTLVTIVLLSSFFSCTKKESESIEPEKTKITLNSQNVKLHFDETFALVATVTPKPLDVLWLTTNETIAKVSQEGIVSGVKIGESTITAKTTEAEVICAVTVEPYESFVTEPLVDFGENKDYVKDNENRVLYNETADGLVYEDNSNSLVDYVFYMFENGVLDGSSIMFNQSIAYFDSQRFSTFFKERYDYVGSQDGVLFYETPTVTLGIGVYQGTLLAIYFENSSKKSATTIHDLVNIYRKKVDNQVHKYGLIP